MEAYHAIELIKSSVNDWGGWGHENSQLELPNMALELWAGDKMAHHSLSDLWMLQKESTRVSAGIYRRSPDDPKANSHDNWFGLAVGSAMYDFGNTASEILSHGVTAGGLWITGRKPKQIFDSEWLTPLRPEYRSSMRLALAAGDWKVRATPIEQLFMMGSLHFSTSYNMKRARILYYAFLGEQITGLSTSYLKYEAARLGDKYKERYGNDPIYKELWRLNGGGYGAF